MDTTKQRIAIAEACGWNPTIAKMYAGERNRKVWEGVVNGDVKTVVAPSQFPDYLNDLNAMHEAEKVLTTDHLHEYYHRLALEHGWEHPSATAAQRAESLLRTLGKWEE